jgi:penicillin-binding protein 2
MALLSRQKKMRLDPDAPPKPGKRQGRTEQLFLNRRVFLARGAIVAGFAALAGKLGFMQIVQHQAWATEADNNVRRVEYLKSPRGLIYDRQGRLLADNRRTWEVRIVPANLPQDETERRAVLDQLINALALPDALVVDPSAIPVGEEEVVHGGLVGTMAGLGMCSSDDVQWWLDKLRDESGRNYLVLVDDALSADEAAQFRALGSQLPGVYVMNLVDYAVGNVGDPRLAVPIKTGVPKEIALRLEANQLQLPGIQVVDNVLVRRYHGGTVMSHVLGYARRITGALYEKHEDERYENGAPVYELDDTIGQDGLEFSLETQLRGVKGKRFVEVDSHQVMQRELTRTEPTPGRSLKLTLDLELQEAVSRILKDAIDFTNQDRPIRRRKFKYPAQSGAVVAIDPRDGAVLAMVSFPHYDNQLFVDGISQRQYKDYTDDKIGAPLFNRTIAASHPSGSSIKPFTALGALRDKKITPEDRFYCSGCIIVPWDWDESKGNKHPCWLRDGGHGPLNVYEALERSCDVFFYNVGAPQDRVQGATEDLRYYDWFWSAGRRGDKHYFRGLGIKLIEQHLTERFWFGRPTGIDLPGEKTGIVPNDTWKRTQYKGEGWSLGDTINVSIGQGFFQTTPLQMALNTAALANFGKVWRPRLVEALLDEHGAEVEKIEPELLRQIKIKPEQFDVVREGMRRVVHSPDSAASHWTDPVTLAPTTTKWPNVNPEGEEEIVIGGKTGTAEVGEQLADGTYDRQHAWFVCFAPFDEPEIALAVVIEEGGEGSDYAVPVADEVLRAYFELTGRRERGLILPKTEGGSIPEGQESQGAAEQSDEPEGDAESDAEQSNPGTDGSPLLE